MLKDYLKDINIEPTDEILEKFSKFSCLLLEWNEKINLTSIIDKDEIEVKHFIDSLTILKTNKINETSKIIDVGCGAGFPSFPLKFIYPHLDVTMLDSLNKRVLFQENVKKELNLTNLNCIHSRAEEGGRNKDLRGQFDISCARAVANLSSLIELCIPFVKTGGYFIAMKGSDAEEEIHGATNALLKLNCEIENVISLALPELEHKRNIIVIKKLKETDKKYPRNAPKPIKEPI